MMEIFLVVVLAILLGWPLGRYLAAVMRGEPMRGDGLFKWFEQPVYAILGVNPKQGMSVRTYVTSFIVSNIVLGAFVFTIFMTQAWLPLNPDHIPNMSWDLALHTMVSFITNTDQQHYSGQAQLSYLAQMTAIVGLQFLSPVIGLAMVTATLRGLFGGRQSATQSTGAEQVKTIDVGNYWADLIRPLFRVMLPLSLVLSVLLSSQGVPATLEGGPTAHPIDVSAKMVDQKLTIGPVAPMIAIKQIGTNGGGWYGPNSAAPYENPTPFSNLLELLTIVLLPVSVVFMVGAFTGRKKLTAMIFGSMMLMSVISTSLAVWSEGHSSVSHSIALMEGKEVRLGADTSAFWAAITTQTSNGSVNMMHDSNTPITALVEMSDMLINAIWGGVGCGLQQFLVYLILTVFLAGLMTGRTPELFGRKVEAPEIRRIAILILLQPLVILGFASVAFYVHGLAATSNPGFHGISQALYEYISAFANNGSGFGGLGTGGSKWWDVSCTVVLIAGRYPALIIPLLIAGLMAAKRRVPESAGSLNVETPTFALTLVAVVLILTLLQFMPVLVLGPIADHLMLVAG